jgi:Rieske 2Fe-2S family protein
MDFCATGSIAAGTNDLQSNRQTAMKVTRDLLLNRGTLRGRRIRRAFVPEFPAMNNLSHTEHSLPSSWYFDPAHFQAELDAVWYREWVCVGRLDAIPRTGDYFLAEIGSQRLIVTRDRDGKPRAFHNTCRHRGSLLCTESGGRFKAGRIVCPYHTWTYSLQGTLVATPGRFPTPDFSMEDHSLYSVHADCWGGYIFINLAETPAKSLQEFLGEEARFVERWPLAEMVSVQQDRTTLGCNWKIFWENYSECYHCPRIHPELCKIMPLYKQGVFDAADLPAGPVDDAGDGNKQPIASRSRTWTLDGKSRLPFIPGLGDAETSVSVTFASFTASMFVVAHPDYVRSVRMLPRGPESVELTIDWLLLPGIADAHAGKLGHLFEMGRLLVEQDGRVCELNQQGLKSRRHQHGVLMPQEYALRDFHRWLRTRLAMPTSTAT